MPERLEKTADVPFEDPAPVRNFGRIVIDGALAALLVLLLSVVYVLDFKTTPDTDQSPPNITGPPADFETEPEPIPEPPVILPPKDSLPPIDPAPRIVVNHDANGKFGVSTTTGNPDDASDDQKKLTFAIDGSTNNTRLWVDGATPILGGKDGRIIRPISWISQGRLEFEWEYNGIRATRTVELVTGEVSRGMDTLNVHYRLENHGSTPRTVGLRVMIDSLIGDNDGVPFLVPGQEGLVVTPQAYAGEEVPSFVRALEVANLLTPGIIVDLGLVPLKGERPAEVFLTHWPGSEAKWNYDRNTPFDSDSAIGLYYKPAKLSSGDVRMVSFTYGLGTISSTKTKNANLSLTAGGPFRASGKFWLVALVQNSASNQEVNIVLPEGLTLGPGEEMMKPVPAGEDFVQLSWLVHVAPTLIGATQLAAKLEPQGVEERFELVIEPRDAKLSLLPQGPFRQGKPFWVTVLVQHPRAEQNIRLDLPDGLKLVAGDPNTKSVPHEEGYAQVNWFVTCTNQLVGKAEISAHLLPDGINESAEIEIETGSLID